MNIKWLCISSGLLLFLAILYWPYAYYVLLRWVIFISASIVAYSFYKSKFPAWVLTFGGIAFLFNPIYPVYLTREIWAPIDLISAVLFFRVAFLKK